MTIENEIMRKNLNNVANLDWLLRLGPSCQRGIRIVTISILFMVSILTAHSQIICCQGDTLTFVPNTFDTTNTYFWDFDDGTTLVTTDSSVVHAYASTGGYSVTLSVMTPFSCSSPTEIVAIDIRGIIITGVVVTDAECGGAIPGAIDITFSGGTPPYTFTWSNGDTSEDLIGITSGLYELTISDAEGCQQFVSATVSAIPDTIPPVLTCPNDTAVSLLPGSCSTFVDIPLSPATDNCGMDSVTNDYNFLPTLSDDYPSGITLVNVTAVDLFGLTDTCSFKVTVGTAIDLFDMSADTACTSEEINFTSLSPGGALYLWDFGDGGGSTDENPSHTYTQPGTYTVSLIRIGAVSGCAANHFEYLEIEGVALSLEGEKPCTDSTGMVEAIIPPPYASPLTYAWSGPGGFSAATASISELSQGTYTLTVTDSTGCANTDSISLFSHPPVSFASSVVIPCGDLPALGSISITGSGGYESFKYSIDSGSTFSPGNTFSNLPIGDYDLQLMDTISFCVFDVGTESITSAGIPISYSNTTTDASVAGNDGTLTFTGVSGGSGGPYEYSIDGGATYSASPTFTGLIPGEYPVIVRDGPIGCISHLSNVIVYGFLEVNFLVYQVACIGIGHGATVEMQAVGGTPPFTYNWATVPPTTNNFFEEQPGGPLDYSIYDSGFLRNVGTYSVPFSDPFSFSVSQVNISAPGADDGEISIIPSGSIGPYTYMREFGTIDNVPEETNGIGLFASLPPGLHRVAVLDGHFCMTIPPDEFITITEPPGPGARFPGTSGQSPTGKIRKEQQSSSIRANWNLMVIPNPFSTTTRLYFTPPHSGTARVEIWTLSGTKVQRLFEKEVPGGIEQSVEFSGDGLSAGVYLGRADLNKQLPKTIKLILVK